MWVLHSWSPWLTHSNTFLMWHSYFNTIFIYSFKISLNHNSEKWWREDKLLELYNFPQSWKGGGGREKKKWKNTYFLRIPNRTKSIVWTLYNLQFSNHHHNIAVNVTLNLSLREKKYTVNLRRFYSTATGGESAREPKETSAIHSLTHTHTTVLHYDWHCFNTEEGESHLHAHQTKHTLLLTWREGSQK